ncbi:MAG: hypothetical protein K1X79_06505 [Oligoflexia bacterium]|nr:hypothetical protein [Oligoflexia bacterium]
MLVRLLRGTALVLLLLTAGLGVGLFIVSRGNLSWLVAILGEPVRQRIDALSALGTSLDGMRLYLLGYTQVIVTFGVPFIIPVGSISLGLYTTKALRVFLLLVVPFLCLLVGYIFYPTADAQGNIFFIVPYVLLAPVWIIYLLVMSVQYMRKRFHSRVG